MKVHPVFGSAVELGVPVLSSVTDNLSGGKPLYAGTGEALAHAVQILLTNDRVNTLHCRLFLVPLAAQPVSFADSFESAVLKGPTDMVLTYILRHGSEWHTVHQLFSSTINPCYMLNQNQGTYAKQKCQYQSARNQYRQRGAIGK